MKPYIFMLFILIIFLLLNYVRKNFSREKIELRDVNPRLLEGYFATLRCKYIKGIPYLSINTLCEMDANEAHLLLSALGNHKKQIAFTYDRILEFQHVTDDRSDYISMKYNGSQGISDIIFSISDDVYIKKYNDLAANDCSLIDYVNAQIAKYV